jgi:hypothetical protein
MASLPTSSSQELPALGQAFAVYLDATNLYPGLSTVDCVAQDGRLVLFASHGYPEIDDPRALLRELETAFMELMPAVGLPDDRWAGVDAVPVRICLRLRSARRPYATHTFTWRVEDAARAVFPPAPTMTNGATNGAARTPPNGAWGNGTRGESSLGASSTETSVGTSSLESSSKDQHPIGAADGPMAGSPGPWTGENQTEPPPFSDRAIALPDATSKDQHPIGAADGPMAGSPGPWTGENQTEPPPFSDRAIALPDATIEPPADWAWLKGGWRLTLNQLQALSQYWIYGLAGVIVLGSGLFAYALSRPCVVGSCERLDNAEAFYGNTQAQLEGSPDGEALRTAQTDLQAAIDLLSPIPQWAPYYTPAQANLQQYRREVAALNALIQAKDTALQAANLSQNPPHPVQRWVDVQLLWQQSVDLLEMIPAESPAFAYAQQKLEEYGANYKAIGRRIVAEEEAEANFSTAMQTAQLAQQRMDTAESLAGWQLTAKEWQAAIKGLSLIPQGTSAYGEAQTYLRDYRQQLDRTTAQATLEENSTRFYQQAVQAAREAKAFEARNQWTLAVMEWQRAVARTQQIAPDSILGSEASPLLETYQLALTNAQSRLRTAVALQNLTQTVGSLCAGSATPCGVTEDPSQIQVTLSSQYAEPLRQAITPPAADGTFAFTNELSTSVQALIEQIIAISHQVDRQVAIYDAQGSFIARYRPDLGGFIKN